MQTRTEAGEMKIKIIDLTEENLHDTPEWAGHPYSCKYCIYWEFPRECTNPSKEVKEEVFKKKLEWLEKTRAAFGNCGKLAYLDSRCVGYAQYAPAAFLPNSAEYPAGPVSQDAVFISCLFIPDKEAQGQGIGSQLLGAIIDDLKDRGAKAVESFARRGNPENPSGPLEFYLAKGFKIARDDPEFPLVRLEL
jgi:GNAT superfamily N-acetyltransferase